MEDLGHTIVPAVPSLFTFNIKDSRIIDLPGLSTDASVKVLDEKGKTSLSFDRSKPCTIFIEYQINKHKGSEVVLINFWATYCAPCIEEFPMIVDLSKC